jgi:Tol biopolymer transport system component
MHVVSIRLALGLVTGLALSATAAAQATWRVSVDSAGRQGDSNSRQPALSDDGRFVAFASASNDLVAGDVNGRVDIFVRDGVTGAVEPVSVDSSANQSNGDCEYPTISSDGRFVCFDSDANNLDPGDNNAFNDVFVRDRATGTTVLVSVDSNGNGGNQHSFGAAISGDGQRIVFQSYASNLVSGDTNNALDIFLHDVATGATTRMTENVLGIQANANSFGGAISSDGAFVAFTSYASNLVPHDTNAASDVFVREVATGTIERASVDPNGVQGNLDSGDAALSADGSLVAFASGATNLVAGDNNGTADIFVHDRGTGTNDLVSVAGDGSQADDWSDHPALSADGSVVTFTSNATDLVAGDVNGTKDAFLHDRATGETLLVSRSTFGDASDYECLDPTLARDGVHAAFSSYTDKLVNDDTNHFSDVFEYDRSFVVVPAAWSNYDAGLAGTLGVPQLTASAPPVFGTTIDLDATDSATNWSVGFLAIGLQRCSLPFAGGRLLALPLWLPTVPVAPWGAVVTAPIPKDPAFLGVVVDLQLLELDAGAPHGISLSPGLELQLGL